MTPEVQATVAFGFTVGLLALLRLDPRRGPRLERLTLAVFLAAMPVVYLEAGWRSGVPLGVEWVGLAVYAVLAAAGQWGSPWLLVAGIALHGLGWDLWHVHRGVVADWYAVGCAVVDLSLAGYAASRVRAWQAAQSQTYE